MTEVISQQPPQHFLQLIKRLYDKRDEVLESSNKLVDYSHQLEESSDSELHSILSEILKEMNRIIANIHELSPHLKNPHIADAISEQVRLINLEMEQLAISRSLRKVWKFKVAMLLRTFICQEANKTQLRPTPKSIKKAFGIAVSPRELKLFFEYQLDNY